MEKDTSFLVRPAIKKEPTNKVEEFIVQYPKRFEYILAHYWGPKSYPAALPIDAIKEKYLDEIEQEELAIKGIAMLLGPVLTKIWKSSKISFQIKDLQKVASRFFYLQKKPLKDRPDLFTLFCFICIGKNGQMEETWPKDFILLEAFAYEAILGAIINSQGQEPFFVIINDYMKKFKGAEFAATKVDTILLKERKALYTFISEQKALEQSLRKHYQENYKNLPFTLL